MHIFTGLVQAVTGCMITLSILGAMHFIVGLLSWLVLDRGKYGSLENTFERIRLDETDVKGFG